MVGRKIHIGKTDRCGTGGSLARRFLLAWGDKTEDTYIAEHQSHAQKIKKDIKWMQDQASTHGLLGHPALTQPIKNILLEEAKRENLAITLENGPDNTLTIHPVTAPLENVSRWLTTAQVTYGIVIEDLQFTLAGNEEITLRHLSFREQQ